MIKREWYCREIGLDGEVAVFCDQLHPSGIKFRVGHVIHPFMLDEAQDRHGMFRAMIAVMTWELDRACAQPVTGSRACAFGGSHEAPNA